MWHDFIADDKFFAALRAQDQARASQIRTGGCPHCGGRLDQADYPRKPRGGVVALAGESVDRRTSFCCAVEGCRRRATPPSLVFLGRRVYLGLVVLCESVRAAADCFRPIPARRTARRWLSWFRFDLPKTDVFQAACGLFSPPPDMATLPGSLISCFSGGAEPTSETWAAVLAFLSPLGASPALSRAGWAREM